MDYIKLIEDAESIGCVGTHDEDYLPNIIIPTTVMVGLYLGRRNKRVKSGNAKYCDQLYAQGCNAADPTLVDLYVVNERHNAEAIVKGNNLIFERDHPEWAAIAQKYHGSYDYMKPYVKSLFNRNAGIVTDSNVVIGFPNLNNKGWGGTGHDFRIANGFNIPVINLAFDEVRTEFLKQILATGVINGNNRNGGNR